MNHTRQLDRIQEGPPAFAFDRWFHDDLGTFTRDELREERLQYRLLFTPPFDRDFWPAVWVRERIDRINAELSR